MTKELQKESDYKQSEHEMYFSLSCLKDHVGVTIVICVITNVYYSSGISSAIKDEAWNSGASAIVAGTTRFWRGPK